jgi:hypothetical protein
MQRLWDGIKDIAAVFWPARFAIGVVLLSIPFLFLLGPSQDALLAAVAQQHSDGSKALLAAFVLLWAVETFYWAHFMSRLPEPPKGERSHPTPAWRTNLLRSVNRGYPFWLGLVALAIAGLAAIKANGDNPDNRQLVEEALAVLVVLYVFITLPFGDKQMTGLMWLLVATPGVNRVRPLRRRRMADGPQRPHHRDLFRAVDAADQPKDLAEIGRDVLARTRGCQILLGVLVVLTFAVYWACSGASLGARQWIATAVGLVWLVAGSLCVVTLPSEYMVRSTKFWVVFNFLLFVAIFIASLFAATLIGSRPNLVTSPLVIFSAFAAWVFFGTFFLALPAELFRLPVTSAVLALTVLLSLLPGDNHDVRKLADGGQPPGSVPLSEVFAPWLAGAKAQWKKDGHGDAGPVPLIIVATAGGASRAGYWTAKVLGELEDQHPGFHNYVFAISSVSGGTLGAGVWRAMVGNQACDNDRAGCARRFFCQDFLGPLFLSGLYADLTQRILPGGLLPDRAAALEQAWEKGWANVVGGNGNAMSAGFHALGGAGPFLLINGTSEKSGRRIITSQLQIDKGVFPDAIDFFATAKAELSFSAALHNSARFTYLDAAGNVLLPKDGKEIRNDRILDGGYFENFGADTAYDLLQALRSLGADGIRPVILQISSDPALQDADYRDKAWAGELGGLLNIAADVTAPLVTLYQSRDAHGVRATALDRQSAGAANYIHFRLTDTRIPMSWAMSGEAVREIDAEWDTPQPANDAARKNLAAILWSNTPLTTHSKTPSPAACAGLP